MEINLEWLKDFVDVPELADLCELLTGAGIEVEEVRDPAQMIQDVVVALVEAIEPHPKASKLKICQVKDGEKAYRVVCGAANVAEGQRVALARVGASLPGLRITRRTIRGVESEGMLCSRMELGLAETSDGIWVLPDDYLLGDQVVACARVGATLTLGITPNRPDLLSHNGVAREIAAATGQRLRSPNWRVTEVGPDARSMARVVIEDPTGCRRYCTRIVRNVKVGPSPAWLSERLEAIGQRPINNVVDATNYVLHELGHPLHAFDLARIASASGLPTIRVRSAKIGERLTTLDGLERQLCEEDLLIADAERAIALAGVMGGQSTEVVDSTANVLLEAAWFDPLRVRRSVRRHGLHTEASHRFERGADLAIVMKAIDRCAQVIADVAGGEVAKGVVEVSQKVEPLPEVHLRLDRVKKILGVSMPAETVVQLLDPLEIRCQARNEGSLRFAVPSFRPDLLREIDLIEELARRYGYDKFPERLPDASGEYCFQSLPDQTVEHTRCVLLGCGLSEAVTWGIGSPDIYATYGYGEEKPIRLSNPVGEEMSVLRTSLVPGLLLSLGRNQRHGARSVRLFEIGTTFHSRAPTPEEDERDSKLPLEVVRVGLLLWGERHDGRWYGGGERVDFGDLSGVLENLAEALDLEHAIERQPATMANLHPLAGARLVLDGEPIGLAGQLHPERADALELGGPVYVAELSMAALVAADRRRIGYTPIHRFPGTRRDVAVVVDREVPSENIRRFLQDNAGGELGAGVIERVRLFDVYHGKGIAKSKVSLAFGIDYRHAERTLTDAEVNEAFDTVVERLKTELEVEVRQ